MIACDVLYEYKEYIPQVVITSQCATSHICGKILTRARLDAFTLMLIYCLCDDVVDNVGNHRQRLYSDTFSLFSLPTFSKLTGTVAWFVNQWCPEEIEVLFTKTYDSTFSVPLPSFCEATVKVFFSLSKQRLIAVSSKWFD